MNVKETIVAKSKNRGFTELSNQFILNPQYIPELLDLALSDLKHPFPEYASWLLLHIVKKKPELIEAYQPMLIDRILVTTNQSVLRNLVNISGMLPLVEHKESEYLDRLVQFIGDDSNKVALFYYSISKLIQFTKKYPEIKHEIEGIISLKQEPLQPAMRIGIRNYHKEVSSVSSM